MRLTQDQYIELLGIPAFCSRENPAGLYVRQGSPSPMGTRNSMTCPADSSIRTRSGVQGAVKRMGR